MNEPSDRTTEVQKAASKLEVLPNSYCNHFEQDTGRLFSAQECWYCKYGDFGINTEQPTKKGECRFRK